MIEGIEQGILYNDAAQTLEFHLRDAGDDLTLPDAAPTVTLYDPAGTEVQASAAMSQVGSTAIYTIAVDTTTTTSFPKGANYRARIKYILATVSKYLNFFFDVCMDPINDPLWSTEDIDTKYPMWKVMRPGDWSDWKEAIEEAHRWLLVELRRMKDNTGEMVYPFRILSRSSLQQVELWFIKAVLVEATNSEEEEKIAARNFAVNELAKFTEFYLDRDDDLVRDSDEMAVTGITHLR